MIYAAKRDSENWIVVDEENETVAKAKVQFKKHNAYGKVAVLGNEYELLYNPLAFKNNRPRVSIFNGDNDANDATYSSFKFEKKYGLYHYYQLRFDRHSYYCYVVKSGSKKTTFYIYDHNVLICVLDSVSSKQYEIVDLYFLDSEYLNIALLFLISLQILRAKKTIGISQYAPAPLNQSDTQFVFRVKEKFLKESSSYEN